MLLKLVKFSASLFTFLCFLCLFITPDVSETFKGYSRDRLLSLRTTILLPSHDVRLRIKLLIKPPRGCRAGKHVRARRRHSTLLSSTDPNKIPVVISNRHQTSINSQHRLLANSRPTDSNRVLVRLKRQSVLATNNNNNCPRTVNYQHRQSQLPALYVFNSSSLAKPNAVNHLAADLRGYHIDIGIITETHLKPSIHIDNILHINGYVLFRRDRLKRRGGGVAFYVSDQATIS